MRIVYSGNIILTRGEPGPNGEPGTAYMDVSGFRFKGEGGGDRFDPIKFARAVLDDLEKQEGR